MKLCLQNPKTQKECTRREIGLGLHQSSHREAQEDKAGYHLTGKREEQMEL